MFAVKKCNHVMSPEVLMIANKSWHTVNSLFTDTSTRWTPRVGSCLSLPPLFDTLCPEGVCVKADFHERESRSRSCDQKCRAYDLVKTVFWFHLQLHCLRFAYDLVKVYRLLESEAEAEELNQSQSMGTCIVIGLSFCFCFQWKWKRSDSSDSNSAALVTLIFYFH